MMVTDARLEIQGHTHLSLAGIIVSNYVSRNTMAPEQVSAFLEAIYATVVRLAEGKQLSLDVEASLRQGGLGGIAGLTEAEVAATAARVSASQAQRSRDNPNFKSSDEIKASVTPDAIISFLDGRPYKSMRRHLQAHNLTAEQYRDRFNLPVDYPLVAPSYSAQRSALAKAQGLGSGKTAPPQIKTSSSAKLSKNPSARRSGSRQEQDDAPTTRGGERRPRG